MQIQTDRERTSLQQQIAALGPWFYRFEFSCGADTEPLLDENAREIHRSRAQMIYPHLDRLFAGRWPEVTCLDIACHEGWFAFQVAQRGAAFVKGIDLRPERIERARFVQQVGRFENVQFEVRDLYELDPATEATVHLTLFLGIFYHLEDPMRALRRVRAMTGEVCVLEGQVARGAPELVAAWAHASELRHGPACAVLPADPNHARSGFDIVLVPTLSALEKMLWAAGFSDVQRVQPTPDLHEQYVSGDRVVILASV